MNGNKMSAADEEYSDDDDDDDPEDIIQPTSDMEDYLDEGSEVGGDDVCDLDDDDGVGSVASNTSTTFSGSSSVGSNTPSLIGENLESFCLGETEKIVGGGGDASSSGTAGGGGAAKWQQVMNGSAAVKTSIKPLRRSLFTNVPPSITFMHHNEVPEVPLPAEVRKHLRWKLSNITPAVVKRVVANSGFRLMRKSGCGTEWGGLWGKHMKSAMFKESVHECQKLNHFPGTFNIGRKDRLWKNYHRMRQRFGKAEFGYLPRTFLLPGDSKLLRKAWERRGCGAKWIVKPPALARGSGIKVVNKWSQIPRAPRPLIVQRYVARPHLINGTKYDLRIYVLMTSVSPLRIYLYDEGLVRFASNPYRADNASLADIYTHLTNYSINKNSSTYQANEDPERRQGHKWTLASLWQHFAESGVVDCKPILEAIKDLIIKTFVSAEASLYTAYRQNVASHYCAYELFGFDVLLDSKLKPWLIEVNISPSLHSSSPLDLDVKSPLATEVFNLVRFHVPPAKLPAKIQREVLAQLNVRNEPASSVTGGSSSVSNSGAALAAAAAATPICLDRRLYTRELTKAERAKQDRFVAAYVSSSEPADQGAAAEALQLLRQRDRSVYLEPILEHLTPDDVRCLIRHEDEVSLATRFLRIFPTQDTAQRYFRFLEAPRYHNLLLDAWETKYGDCHRAAAIDRLERLCVDRVHLKVPSSTSTNLAINPASSASASSSVPATSNVSSISSIATSNNLSAVPNTALAVDGGLVPFNSPVVGKAKGSDHSKPKKLKSFLDTSMLKGPTGACLSKPAFIEVEEANKVAQPRVGVEAEGLKSPIKPSSVPGPSSTAVPATAPVKVKVGQISVTAKPSFVKAAPTPMSSSARKCSPTKQLSCSTGSDLDRVGSSPEPMSVEGDTASDGDQGKSSVSRSPSPSPPLGPNAAQAEENMGIPNDNRNLYHDNPLTMVATSTAKMTSNTAATAEKNQNPQIAFAEEMLR